MKKTIEEILGNRIAYIGEEIPEALAKDKRAKSVYLGYPQQLIDELTSALQRMQSEGDKFKGQNKRIAYQLGFKAGQESERKRVLDIIGGMESSSLYEMDGKVLSDLREKLVEDK